MHYYNILLDKRMLPTPINRIFFIIKKYYIVAAKSNNIMNSFIKNSDQNNLCSEVDFKMFNILSYQFIKRYILSGITAL